jgi:predicted lipoprotein
LVSLLTSRWAAQVLSIKEHALVEYADVRAAARAVKELTDSDNWRFGLRVKPTVQQLR